MRLLLDTHVALWAIAGAPQLSIDVVEMIRDPENDVAVSMASLWEIAIKNGVRRTGRGAIGLSVTAVAEHFGAATFDLVPFDIAALQVVEGLPHHHGDPFDRMILATAITRSYRLVTHDKVLSAYSENILLV